MNPPGGNTLDWDGDSKSGAVMQPVGEGRGNRRELSGTSFEDRDSA
jgi:hypothetical protein